LTVDVVELDRPVYDQYEELPDLFLDVPHGNPVRLIVDLERRELTEREEIPYTTAPDFPSIDLRLSEKPYRDLWLLGISTTGRPGRKFFDQLVHCDWQTRSVVGSWQAPPGSYLGGEPVFVPDPSGSGGAVVTQLFDTAKKASSFLLFAAHDVASGPRAVLHLDTPIHLGFHTSFYA
jgi:carotenoid cleavage dioxygenase-like enzyme